MRGFININPMVRAVGVIAAVTALVGGVTFAALNDTATLTSTTVSSGTANLLVSNGGDFGETASGYTITGLVPGVGVTKSFYLKNAGDIALNVKAHVTNLPTANGFSGWENFIVKIKGQNCGSTITTDMATLNAGDVSLPCNALTAGAEGNGGLAGTEGNYDITFDILPSSISGNQAGVGAFDLAFTGNQ